MPNRTYALLVGINDYPQGIGKLSGCLSDVDRFQAYLAEHAAGRSGPAVEVLKDSEATRANIITLFRSHLGRAKAGDSAVFHYCGHGARSASNAAFKALFPDGMDEGLVCFDSRRPGGHDLADKELAVLIAELAYSDAEVAVLLDCCHSGSATRQVDAFRGLTPRLAHDVLAERPLASYLDGHYARLNEANAGLAVPTGRHILLSACERGQLAQEQPGVGGVFTSTLVEVLQKHGGGLSYADLFMRCRAAVRSHAFDQDPQFEAYGRFDAGCGFLGRDVARTPRYSATFANGGWTVNCGALHGVPAEPEAAAAFTLYHSGSADTPAGTPAGTATARSVGAQATDLTLDFNGDETQRYAARITSLPVAPLAVAFVGDAGLGAVIQRALDDDRSIPVVLVDNAASAHYAIAADPLGVQLLQGGHGRKLGHLDRTHADPTQTADALLAALKRITQWEFGLALQNAKTALDKSLIEAEFAEALADGREPGASPRRQTGSRWLPPRRCAGIRCRRPVPRRTRLRSETCPVRSWRSAAPGRTPTA